MKQAVAVAKAAIADLYADVGLPEGLALEEIELSSESGRECWAVTLGFFARKRVSVQGGGVANILQPGVKVENRDYKTLYIDATSGEFVKMEMRLVA